MDAGGAANTVVSKVVDSLALSIKDLDVRNFNRNHAATIHQVSIDIRKGNETAYTPRSFPIGPYHRHEDIKDIKLLYLNGETSGIKILYLQNLLDRYPSEIKFREPVGEIRCFVPQPNPYNNQLERYASEIKFREEDARDCYHDRCKGVESKDFVEMMVLDGCFIVEFFLKYSEKRLDWPFTSKPANLRDLKHDLMLMENQIPFFILKLILHNSYVVGNLKILDLALNCLDLDYCFPCEKITKEMLGPIHQEEDGKNVYHLLHLNYLCHMIETKPPPETLQNLHWQKPNLHNRPKVKAKKEKQRIIPTATELNESGVKFKRKKDAKHYMDVSFQNGVMEIPVVFIDDDSESIFRNFLALEQNCPKVIQKEFTSYVSFLDDLIDTASDVAFLKKNKIIESMLGCDEDVAKFFNGVMVGMDISEDHYLDEIFEGVHVHWNKDHNRWRAMMMRDYFSSPWSIISLFGALTLLAIAALEVSYTIKNSRS